MPMDFPTGVPVGTYYNGYIYQGSNIWDSALQPTAPALLTKAPVYANEAARTTAVPTPTEGSLSYLDDINQFQGYAGTSWRPLGGLAPIVPPTVNFSGGSATANSLGVVSFTAVSSISLNNVFSDKYSHYKIIFETPTTTATTAFNTRFRTAGTDNTVAYYSQLWVMSRMTGTVQSNNGSSATSAGFGTTIALTNRFVSMTGDIVNPFAVKTTELYGQGSFYDATSSYQNNFSIVYDNAVSFDGITIYLSTGTMTGSIQILGYNY